MNKLKTLMTALTLFLVGVGLAVAQESSVSIVEFEPEQSPVSSQAGGVPLFVRSTIHPSGRALVFGLAQANEHDIVLLDNGYDQGFRTGMICEIYRTENLIGEIILVEVREDRAAGLITALHGSEPIRFNDLAQIKTVQP